MSQPPSPALLRLREADVVRLCGLNGAARGLELAARRSVTHPRREGGRLTAVVEDEQPRSVWVELGVESSPAGMRWSCPCSVEPERTEAGAPLGSLGCAHVAATLTTWVRAPADFVAPASTGEPSPPDAEVVIRRPRLAQPALLTTPPQRRTHTGSLSDELARLQPAALTAMTQRVLGVELPEREAVAALALALADAARVAELIERLEPGARELLACIRLLGGAITAADLAGIAERAGRLASMARNEVTTLERRGLLFPVAGAPSGSTQTAHGPHPWRAVTGWRMPPELLAAIPARLPLASTASLPELAAAEQSPGERSHPATQPRILPSSPRALARALALLPFAPGPAGLDPQRPQIPPATHRSSAAAHSVVAALLAGEPPHGAMVSFARGAGVDVGLARLARRTLLWAREDAAEQAILNLPSLPVGERPLALRAGFRLWRDMETAADLSDLEQQGSGTRLAVDARHPALRPAAVAADVLEGRRLTLRVFAAMRSREWYRLDDLVELFWRLNPGFLRGRQLAYETPAWWLERVSDHRPLRVTEREEWLAGEGAFLRAMLRGPLFWWGACDLAIVGNAAVAVRLTPLGAALLRDEAALPEETRHTLAGEWGPPALPTREGGVAVQPLAAGYVLLSTLARWADVREVAGGRLVYSLSVDRACAAFDHSEDAEALPRALQAAGVPGDARVIAGVRERLAGWLATYGKTRITTNVTLIEARDEAALREALSYAPQVSDHARHLGEGLAVIANAQTPALREALNRRGYHA